MPIPVTIPDLPDDVHADLSRQAAARGMTLPEYLRELLAEPVGRATAAELAAEIAADRAKYGPIELDEPSEVTIRRLRDAWSA